MKRGGNEFTKKYYKIREVSEILDLPQSTLRFWESEFKELSPERNVTGRRYYTPEDIEKLKMIKYLLKSKGLKIDAAKQELRHNLKNIQKRIKILDELETLKEELQLMLHALSKRQQV